MNNYKVFANAIVQEDLFFTIYDYIRFNPGVIAKNFPYILSTNDFDKLSVEVWKDIAEDAIYWLEHDQLPKIHTVGENDNSPNANTWGTLYYQTLAYMGRNKINGKTIRQMDIVEITKQCRDCIEDFKNLKDEIRETTYEDI